MIKILFFIFIFLCTVCSITAQKSGGGSVSQWNFNIGAGAVRMIVADKKFSALTFDGTTVSGLASVGYQRNNVSHQLDFCFASGTLQTGNKESSLQNNYFNVDYINLYKLGKGDGRSIIYKAGACVNVLYAGRSFDGFINNNTSFDFAASIGVAASLQYFFGDPSAGFSLGDRIEIPVLSVVVQPAFGSNNASGSLDKAGFSASDIFNHSSMQSFNAFVRIRNVLGIEKRLAERHQIALNYTWDYYRLSGDRKVQQAIHTMALSYCFIL
jgi:hypothetical protein